MRMISTFEKVEVTDFRNHMTCCPVYSMVISLRMYAHPLNGSNRACMMRRAIIFIASFCILKFKFKKNLSVGKELKSFQRRILKQVKSPVVSHFDLFSFL